MHDQTHITAGDSEYCESCGQLIRPAPSYGERGGSNRIGIALSVLLHVLIVGYYLMRPAERRPVPPPNRESAMVYIAPLASKPTPPAPARQPAPSKVKAPPAPPRQRPALAITPPRPKLETVVPPVVAPVPTPVQEVDMAAYIAARQKQRGAAPAPEAVESESERANRVARANIANAQGKNAGSDREDSGGLISVVEMNSYSATVRFRSWNGNFKRKWLSEVRVELGGEINIETAIIKQMISMIRKEFKGDIPYESHRLGRLVVLSARLEDTAELHAFLLKEVFPDYRLRR